MKFYITILLLICSVFNLHAQHDWDEIIYEVEIDDVKSKNLYTITKFINGKFFLVTPQNKHLIEDYEKTTTLNLLNTDDFEDFYPFEIIDNDGNYYDGLVTKIEDEVLYINTENGEEEIHLYDIDEIINTIIPSKVLQKANNDPSSGKAISVDFIFANLSAKDEIISSNEKAKAFIFYPQINFTSRLKKDLFRHYYGLGYSIGKRKVGNNEIDLSTLSFNYGMSFIPKLNNKLNLLIRPGFEMLILPIGAISELDEISSDYDWFPGFNVKIDLGVEYNLTNSIAIRSFVGFGRNLSVERNKYRNIRYGVSLIFFR